MTLNLQCSVAHCSNYPDFFYRFLHELSSSMSVIITQWDYINAKKSFQIAYYLYNIWFLKYDKYPTASETIADILHQMNRAISYNIDYSNGRIRTVFICIQLNSLTFYCYYRPYIYLTWLLRTSLSRFGVCLSHFLKKFTLNWWSQQTISFETLNVITPLRTEISPASICLLYLIKSRYTGR